MKKNIAKIVFGLPVEGPFDYLIPEEAANDIQVGQRVIVPFGRRSATGYVTGFAERSELPLLKMIQKVLDHEPIISDTLLELAQWMSGYYGCSLGEAIERMVPFSVRNRKKLGLLPLKDTKESSRKGAAVSIFLSHDDRQCFEKIIEKADACLKKNIGVLFLAPDYITSQKVFERVSAALSQRVVRLDSGTSKNQIQAWTELKNGEAMCAVGLRSAVFAPVRNLGLAVVFEEQHYGYKEDQMPFYHARDVILKRAALEQCEAVFVSAAPTVELWAMVDAAQCQTVSFSKKDESEIKLIDLANYKPRWNSALAFPVASAVGQALDQEKKVLVLFNRRGFHTLIKCTQCGHVLKCARCEVSCVYHDDSSQMVCPSCDKKYTVPRVCPECGKNFLHRYGEGVERVESNLAKFFPRARLATFDRETRRVPKSATIVVATQAIFKVLDQMDIDTAVVLDTDAELSRNDFRCHQNVFSFLMDLKKVVASTVFVQTRQPNHPALHCARAKDADAFYRQELSARKELGFPPYQHLFEIMIRGEKEEIVTEQADMIYEQFLEHAAGGFEAMPPQPSFRAKLRDQYRYTIMGKGLNVQESIAHIKKVLKLTKKKRGMIVTINVDP